MTANESIRQCRNRFGAAHLLNGRLAAAIPASGLCAAFALVLAGGSLAAVRDSDVKIVFCETLQQPPVGQVCKVTRQGGALLIRRSTKEVRSWSTRQD